MVSAASPLDLDEKFKVRLGLLVDDDCARVLVSP